MLYSGFIYIIYLSFTQIARWLSMHNSVIRHWLCHIPSIGPGTISTQKVYAECLWAWHWFLQGRSRRKIKDLVFVLAEFINLVNPTWKTRDQGLFRQEHLCTQMLVWLRLGNLMKAIADPLTSLQTEHCQLHYKLLKPQLHVLLSCWDA